MFGALLGFGIIVIFALGAFLYDLVQRPVWTRLVRELECQNFRYKSELGQAVPPQDVYIDGDRIIVDHVINCRSGLPRFIIVRDFKRTQVKRGVDTIRCLVLGPEYEGLHAGYYIVRIAPGSQRVSFEPMSVEVYA